MPDILTAPEGEPTGATTPAVATPESKAPVLTPPVEKEPAVIQPVKTPEKTEPEKTPPTASYEPTGDSGLDLALEFFGKMGLALDSPEIQEASRGNLSYLEAKLASMGEKATGYDKYINLAKDALTRRESGEREEYESRKKVVHEAVGGEDNWKQIQEYVSANAEPEELEQVRSAIKQGGFVAKAVAEHLHRLYLDSTGTSSEPESPTRYQPTAPSGGGAITRQGYLDELNGLVAKIGSHRLDGSPEYAALRKKYANLK